MNFSEKLKTAMQELHLNQRQVCGMTDRTFAFSSHTCQVSRYRQKMFSVILQYHLDLIRTISQKTIVRRLCFRQKK